MELCSPTYLWNGIMTLWFMTAITIWFMITIGDRLMMNLGKFDRDLTVLPNPGTIAG